MNDQVNHDWQAETGDYASTVIDAAESAPGFAGVELRPESHELVVFSVGEPHAALLKVMDESPDNVQVSWRSARYSLAELSAEVRRLMDEHADICMGVPEHDGTGILLMTTEASRLDAEDPGLALGSRYPVTLEHGGPPIPA